MAVYRLKQISRLVSNGTCWRCESSSAAVPAFKEKFPNSGSIINSYNERVKSGAIEVDYVQLKVVDALQQLDNALVDYQSSRNTLFAKLLNNVKIPRGLYLYGSVGCGKTMLMDLFFQECALPESNRRRVHFHSFMLDVHSRIHELKQEQKRSSSSRSSFKFNPIPAVAEEISKSSYLLCLDEFQVTDIGDAMILKQLFSSLWQCGTCMVATSNRPPDDLYKSGLQRSAFPPFIPLLKENCSALPLDSGIDYRQRNLPNRQPIYFLTSENGNADLDKLFKILASRENDTIRARTLNIKGRNVSFARTCGQVADCTFHELCERPLGAIDYLQMSQIFHTVLIRNIPQFTTKSKSQARRFITLIDTFYDHKVRCLFTAQVPVQQLFLTSTSAATGGCASVDADDEVDDDSRKLMDDLGIQLNSEEAKSSIFSGSEEIFAFDRTVSRLSEMQTADYWNLRQVIY